MLERLHTTELGRVSRSLVLGIVASLALGACGFLSKSPRPLGCASTRITSTQYPGDPNANPADQSTWTEGIDIIHGTPGTTVVGFSEPDGHTKDSQPFTVPEGGAILLAKIGHYPVEFSVEVTDSTDPDVCGKPPTVVFGSVEPITQLQQEWGSLITSPHW
ncbi:MAG TPA: hypothetical protein VLF69_03975 [Candidatus Saccharimonadales bacterium]|nr:hypothetical protein [Candidatus Saccharimonadales bacterium]